MTDTTHRLVAIDHEVTECKTTRYSDDGRPFEDANWTLTASWYIAKCSCGSMLRATDAAGAEALHVHHVEWMAQGTESGVNA